MDAILKDRKFILLCKDHYNPLGIVRSLGEYGLSPIAVIVKEEKPYIVSKSKYLKKDNCFWVKSIEEGYNLIISKFGNEELKPFLYSSDDKVESFLDQRMEEVMKKFIFFNSLEPGRITYLMNKDNINKLAIESGLDIPKEEVCENGVLPKTLKYPVITKSIMSIVGNWKGDVYICKSEDELLKAYKNIKSSTVLVQEYIFKKNELCFDGLSINNGKDIFIPYYSTYLRMNNQEYGSFMELFPFKDEILMKGLKNIMLKSGFNGIFSVEFLLDQNDKPLFLEVNFRNSTWSYAYTHGGANLPVIWAKSMLKGYIDLSEEKLRDTSYKALDEPYDFKRQVLTHKISFFRWLWDCFTVDVAFYQNFKDPLPCLSYYFHFAKNIIKR